MLTIRLSRLILLRPLPAALLTHLRVCEEISG
jgi:hypothetical protein